MTREKTRPSYWRRPKRFWTVPFVGFEWVCEWISYGLSRWAFVEILEYAGRFSILIVVVLYLTSADDRRKQKHYQAWQVINTAQGKGGSGGREDALRDLYTDGVSLAGVDLSGGVLLMGIDLSGAIIAQANLDQANLRRADLSWAVLPGATLSDANLHGANLSRANLEKAELPGATLDEAILAGANLTRAVLRDAVLRDADLREANLHGADLRGADLRGADFRMAVLREADLRGTNLRGTNLYECYIEGANIYGVKHPVKGIVEWAKEHGAVEAETDEEWRELIRQAQEREENGG